MRSKSMTGLVCLLLLAAAGCTDAPGRRNYYANLDSCGSVNDPGGNSTNCTYQSRRERAEAGH